MNLRLLLENTVRNYAGKTAVVLGERRLSYAEMDEASNKVANALLKMKVKKGDRVVMLLNNSLEFINVYFGIVKIGAVAVPLDTRYKIEELTSLFDNCQPKILIAESPFLESLASILSRFSSVEHVIAVNSESEERFLNYQEIMANSSAQRIRVELKPSDIAAISYTSGSTNHPRGTTFSHYNLCIEAVIAGDGFQQTDKDIVMLFALPLHHMFGQVTILLTSVNKGSTIVMVPGTGISINSLMETIERERGTMLLVVPYIYALTIKIARREGIKNDLSSLRLCGSGGAPLSINTIRQFKRYYGFTIIDFWGLTEAVAQVTCQPFDGSGKLGASGKVLPNWEMRISGEDGQDLPANQSGEILVRGPIMKGYYHNPQATAEVIKNGWLHTGDIGKVDDNGYLFITGRKKRLIILKGQNVYPGDIEEVLSTHPKIAEVRVMGIPDKLRGEIVRAVIRLREGEVATEHEIRQFCQQRMADYKLPRQIIFTDVLPQTAVAGTRKKNLRHYLSELPSLPYSSQQGKAKL